MYNQPRILFGVTTKSHTELALDEMYGLRDLGYICDQFDYGAKTDVKSKIGRLYILLSNAFKLLFKAYTFKPDFIYLNSRLEFVAGTRDFITLLIVRTLYFKRIHFLVKSHGSDLEVLQTKKILFAKIIFPYLKKNVSGWLFLSTEEVNWILSNKLLDEKTLFLTKNIVRIEKFKKTEKFKEELRIDEDYTTILYIGRLIEEKGIHFVMDAFAKINENHKVVLIIVGDGEELKSVKTKIKKLDIEENVIMTGWVNEDEATYYISNSDLLIFPTFFPEGFPMVLFNSLAAGLPVITTPTRAATDYLTEPENCLWVEPRSSSAIVSAVDTLFNNEELGDKMRKNNKMKANLFTKGRVAEELSSILSAIASNKYDKKFITANNSI